MEQPDFTRVLLLCLLPIGGNVAGGLLAEVIPVSRRTLSLALHAAAGIILAVVALEIMPEAMAATRPWIPIAALVAGCVAFLLLDSMIHLVRHRVSGTEHQTDEQSGAGWAIFFGVAVDLFADGVIIGTGTTISAGLGLMLAIAQVPADLPEGFATIASFKAQGLARVRRIALSLMFALPILIGAAIGYYGVRNAPEIAKLSLLAFTAGILLTIVVEEIIPEAHEDGEARFAALVFIGGFALFAVISAYGGG